MTVRFACWLSDDCHQEPPTCQPGELSLIGADAGEAAQQVGADGPLHAPTVQQHWHAAALRNLQQARVTG